MPSHQLQIYDCLVALLLTGCFVPTAPPPAFGAQMSSAVGAALPAHPNSGRQSCAHTYVEDVVLAGKASGPLAGSHSIGLLW